MIIRLFITLLCTLLTWGPNVADAGAWLREKDKTFTATSFSANYFRDIASTTYMEHGLRDDLTVGLDVGYFTTRFGTTSGFGTVFMRRAIGSGDGPNKWAYELGAGTAWVGDLVLPHVKAGLSWGRGFQLGERYGWMTVDATMTIDTTYGERLSKVDATVGIGVTDHFKGIMQVYVTHLEGETYATIAPSVVYSPPKTKFSIQLGAESPLDNWDNTAIKIGIWREF